MGQYTVIHLRFNGKVSIFACSLHCLFCQHIIPPSCFSNGSWNIFKEWNSVLTSMFGKINRKPYQNVRGFFFFIVMRLAVLSCQRSLGKWVAFPNEFGKWVQDNFYKKSGSVHQFSFTYRMLTNHLHSLFTALNITQILSIKHKHSDSQDSHWDWKVPLLG